MIPHVDHYRYWYKAEKALVLEINPLIDTLNKNDDNDPSVMSDIIDRAKKLGNEPDLVKEMEFRLQKIELLQKQKEEREARKQEDVKRVIPPSRYQYSHPSSTQRAYDFHHSFKADEEYNHIVPHDLYYITHFDNLSSIVENGIFSRNLLQEQNIDFNDIGHQSVLGTRKRKFLNDKNLWSYANVYFNPRNAMLYYEKKTYKNQIAVVEISLDLNRSDLWITDGNAANHVTKFFPSDERDEILPQIYEETIGVRYFAESKEVERKVQAECIVLEKISLDCIKAIHIYDNPNSISEVKRLINGSKLPVIPDSDMFFD